MMQMLASVTNTEEALLALQAEVDIIDLKNPLEGALGALPLPVISEIVAFINHRKFTSATIGDLPMRPEPLLEAIEKTAATGVDIVKVGIFATGDRLGSIEAMRSIAQRVHIVAVLLANEDPNFNLLPLLQAAGFYGVMLDTSNKAGSSLMQLISTQDLQRFIKLARQNNLKCGLAGSLCMEHVKAVSLLNPDYMGFRSALCRNLQRELPLELSKVLELRKLLHESNTYTPNLIET